ncbi:MAG: transcription elongation factor GreA [Chloroflexota bacterium]|nr:transcription elongation factor GreA [Chloroflexota bacterium]
MVEQRNMTLSEAITTFLATLPPDQKQVSQQELGKFIRWYGGDRSISELNAKEISDYGENISSFVTDPVKKLEPVRSFLSFAKKKKLIETSLAPHLRVSKAKQGKQTKGATHEVTTITLTAEGHAAMQVELAALKSERPLITEQIRHAAADKDFRENAPLEAARERQGQIEAQIRELEATLQRAVIIEEQSNKEEASLTIGIGCTVSLRELSSNEQSCYLLVSPSEANPAQGKLSIASPTGVALVNQAVGTIIEVNAPAGILKYQIEEIQSW